jgi:hypothetical protein
MNRWAQSLGNGRNEVHDKIVCMELYRLVICISSVYNTGVFIDNRSGRWVPKYCYNPSYLLNSQNIPLNGVITIW